jgi:hypothetical protein
MKIGGQNIDKLAQFCIYLRLYLASLDNVDEMKLPQMSMNDREEQILLQRKAKLSLKE